MFCTCVFPYIYIYKTAFGFHCVFEKQDCPFFHKYKQLIALDMEDAVFSGTQMSDDQLWGAIIELPSFLAKRGLPKPSRWFAWHEQASHQLSEFFATRCVIEWYLGDDAVDPDRPEATTFKDSKSEMGGLKLLYAGLSFATHEAARVLLHVSRPCWTWYTQQVKDVQSAQEGLQQTIAWSSNWHKDPHLVDICRSMYDTKVLDRLLMYQSLQGRDDQQNDLGRLVFKYGAELLSHRLWSMARYGTCPECFAGLLSADPDTTVSTMTVLKQDWKILCFAEQSGKLKCILSDLQFLFSMPVRLACSLFEQSGWISSDATALSILAAVVKILPDNKIVEDAHQAVRVEAKANPNQRMTIKTIQSTIMNSRIFSSRQLSHPAKLSKDGFFRKWGKKVPQHLSRKSFYSKFHRLPEVFGNIFKKKTWMTLSEEQYGKSYAAWHWIRHFSNCHLSNSGYMVEDTCHGHSNL